MRGTTKANTFGFMTLTLAAIAKAAQAASQADRAALSILADASERAAQWNRDTRALTRQDAAMKARELTALLARQAPTGGLGKAMLMQGLALERYLTCDYRGATDAANHGYRALK